MAIIFQPYAINPLDSSSSHQPDPRYIQNPGRSNTNNRVSVYLNELNSIPLTDHFSSWSILHDIGPSPVS